MGVSGDRWPARSSAAGISSRRAEVFWHSRETEGATRQGVNMEEGLGRERKRRRANAAFNHNCEKTDDGRRGSGPPAAASGLLGMTFIKSETYLIMVVVSQNPYLIIFLPPRGLEAGQARTAKHDFWKGFPSLLFPSPQSLLSLGSWVISFEKFMLTN